jgi:hypothetical protein
MKKRMMMLLMFVGMNIAAIGQEKVEQLKIAYFTKELNLTTSEAEKFWPIYNEMENKIKEIRKNRRKIAKNLQQNGDSLSADVVKKNTIAIFDSEISEINVKKEYYNKIGDAIGYKKASKVYKVEMEFKKKLLHKLKEERGNGGGPGGNRPPRPGGPGGPGRQGGPNPPEE